MSEAGFHCLMFFFQRFYGGILSCLSPHQSAHHLLLPGTLGLSVPYSGVKQGSHLPRLVWEGSQGACCQYMHCWLGQNELCIHKQYIFGSVQAQRNHYLVLFSHVCIFRLATVWILACINPIFLLVWVLVPGTELCESVNSVKPE